MSWMVDVETIVAAAGAGSLVQGVGLWYIWSRIQKVDRIERKIDALVAYFRTRDRDFRLFWNFTNHEG